MGSVEVTTEKILSENLSELLASLYWLHSHGFHTGSILAILSGLQAACINIDTCDLPASNSATSIQYIIIMNITAGSVQ